MCGFAGILDMARGGICRDTVSRQLRLLNHRGPDQSAVHVSPGGRLGFGVCRLSIVDVGGGHQPLVNEDGTVLLAYNGETYNAPELLRTLIEDGHHPRTGSDGEALLHGYELWGIRGVLQKLQGTLAAALWDETRGRLVLARDRFGIKPLYYAVDQGRLCFASELKPILALPGFPRDPDPIALDALLHIGFVPGPRTAFGAIEELPPGHFLTADSDGVRVEPYWSLNWDTAPVPEAQAVERFRDALRDAVAIRLPTEVRFGLLVSGGLDSSAVACLAAAESSEPCRSFSIGFDDVKFDEARWAAAVASHARTQHHEFRFRDADWEEFPAVTRGLEEPVSSGANTALWKLFEGCRREGMTVLLSGEGADELLGGYSWHRGDRLARPLLGLPAGARRVLAALPLPMSSAARRVLQRGNRSVSKRYLDWRQLADVGAARALLSAEYRERLAPGGTNPLFESWEANYEATAATAPLHRALAVESRTYLPDFILHRVDRMSMAHSIEVRVPFLDHRLWELAAGIPASLKFRAGTEKHLLRESMRGIVPEAMRCRRKQPFMAPVPTWLGRERWADWAESCFSEDALRDAGIFTASAVLDLRRAQRARPELTRILFTVLSTQLWHRELVLAAPGP